MVIECKMMYAAPFDGKGFKEVPENWYSHFPAGILWENIGEVVIAWKK